MVIIVVMAIIVTVGMRMRVRRVRIAPIDMSRLALAEMGTTHRMELRDNLLYPRAKPLQHRLDNMVAQDQDSTRVYRGREMAVADVPAEFHQMHRILAGYLIELFLGGDDQDLASTVQHKTVFVLQDDGFSQVYKHLATVDQSDYPPAEMTFVML